MPIQLQQLESAGLVYDACTTSTARVNRTEVMHTKFILATELYCTAVEPHTG